MQGPKPKAEAPLFSPEEIATRKKAIFDAMGKRGQQKILKDGYDEWDPFAEPKEPIDIRTEGTRRTTHDLIHEFLKTKPHESISTSFGKAAYEMALGIVNNDDRVRGLYEFSLWYRDLLIREGKNPDSL
ncbi:hypothetical protein LZ24_00648 [Desulfobotulus alkaliphilus]|uniref:Uncharacterized protein n=1 Tax=Desulfobotulus alkaliphilus TaxID=622671 RepID=A0A562S4J5_9BACT|nr:hypothetical protein [Desulfobotulus alkaliphilus]TWI75600.1 hypothetical protein LZ24_00648 [Desulfobotulus alkaliphilus]